MIQLGLRRAAQLFRNNPQPWHAVHVAGTNGKGTVCTYLSALLTANGVKTGRFTSPHLIDRWDCITINDRPVEEQLFKTIEAEVLKRNGAEKINATEFELLTATAFDIFTHEKVQVGIIEAGMGGRDDATNVLKTKALTILTRIGLDHQAFLGNTVEDITRNKCGIFRQNVPVYHPRGHEQSVASVIEEEAEKVGAGPVWTAPPALPTLTSTKWTRFCKKLRAYRARRLAIGQAWAAFRHLYTNVLLETATKKTTALPQPVKDKSRDAIMNLVFPGRYQTIKIDPLVDARREVFLDGAHNAQAANELSEVVRLLYRTVGQEWDQPVTWVVGYTQGRDPADFLEPLLQSNDRVATVSFASVAGMPWVQSLPTEDLATAVRQAMPSIEPQPFRTIEEALQWAARDERPIVVTGSLYLAADMLRKLRDAGVDIYVGNAELEALRNDEVVRKNKKREQHKIYNARSKARRMQREKGG